MLFRSEIITAITIITQIPYIHTVISIRRTRNATRIITRDRKPISRSQEMRELTQQNSLQGMRELTSQNSLQAMREPIPQSRLKAMRELILPEKLRAKLRERKEMTASFTIAGSPRLLTAVSGTRLQTAESRKRKNRNFPEKRSRMALA